MKYLIAIIAGSILGAASHDGNGYLIGGIIGFLIIQLFELNKKVSSLERQLLDRKQTKKVSEFSTNNSDAIQTTDKEFNQTSTNHPPDDTELNPINAQDTATQSLEIIKKQSDSVISKITEETEIESQLIAKDNQQREIEKAIKQEPFELDRDLIKQMSPEYYNDEPEIQSVKSTSKDSTKTPPVEGIKPSILEIGFNQLKSWVVGYFTGGNSMVRAGMLVLFIGVAFLLKYVAERTVVPVEYRYIGVSLASFFMLFIGWKLRKKRPGFALSLEGGGIGILYLTLFAAMRIHQLLPPHVVLLLLVSIVIFSAVLAILENSMALAIIGMIGGFAAPILTSTGNGSHVQLFSYYLLLNMGVFAIAWFKSWRLLNVLGFVATFGIGTLWGYQYYKPEFFSSVEPFLIGYFLLYTLIAILFAIKQPPKLKGINDGTIIFGTPLVGFALQAALVKDSEYGLAYSALALGVFYIILATILKFMKKPFMKDLIESFVALGIGFATLAIPLGFDGRVTSAMWVAEGSALLWVGIRQSRMFPRFSGYALTAFGAAAFFVEPHASQNLMPWLNADYIGALIIVCASTFISLYSRSNLSKLLSFEAKLIPPLMMVSAVAWWIYAGIMEIKIHYQQTEFILLETFLTVSVFALLFLGKKIKFSLLNGLSILLALIMFAVIQDSIPMIQTQNPMFWNVRFAGLMMIAIVHLYLSWYWMSEKRHQLSIQYNSLSFVFLLLGLITWLVSFVTEIMLYYPYQKFVIVEFMMAVSSFILLMVGIRLKSSLHKLSSAAMVLLMLLPIVFIPRSLDTLPALINVPFLGLLIYSLTHFMMSWYWQRQKQLMMGLSTRLISHIMLVIGLISWVIMGHNELYTYLNNMDFYNSSVIFMTLSAVIGVLLAHRLNWQSLHLIKYVYTLYLVYMCMVIVSEGFALHQSYGLMVWVLAALVNYWLLKLYDNKMQYLPVYHLISLLLFSFILVFEFAELSRFVFSANSIWHVASYSLMLLIISLGLYVIKSSSSWPIKQYKPVYNNYGLLIILTFTWLFVLANNLSAPGNLTLIPYLPLLNSLDLVGFGFVLLAYKILISRIITMINDQQKALRIGLASTAFVILNASMLRCFHFWYGIQYKWNVMLKSFMIQSGFSILWSLTAVVLMVLAAKKHMRTMWLVGLGLMIAVVAKLFLVDMSASGTVERIVAFLSVGVLLSLVGYFSPLPPDAKKSHSDENTVIEENS